MRLDTWMGRPLPKILVGPKITPKEWNGKPLPKVFAKKVERDILNISSDHEPKLPTLYRVKEAVCEHFKISMVDLQSIRRNKNIVHARMIYYCVARTQTSRSYPDIGKYCGSRNHSTVMNGIENVKANPAKYQTDIDAVVGLLN
jgi:chromosomal replication initiator protein